MPEEMILVVRDKRICTRHKEESDMKRIQFFVVLIAIALLAACGGDTKTETVEVDVEVAAPSVKVTGDVAIEVGATAEFTATTADGEDTGYTWASSDEAVATVDEAGVVTGVAAGTAIITATGLETAAAGTWGVHVYVAGTDPQPVPMVMVSGPADVMVGETITLAAETVEGEDASYTWESSAAGTATVEDGVVTGIAVGSATITAMGADTGEAGSWNVYVWEEGEVLTPDARVMVTGPLSAMVGETAEFVATTIDGEDSAYEWESDNEEVATVDADGMVTTLMGGEALITATGADTGAAGIAGIVVIAPEATQDVPFEELWKVSGHNDAESESFVHWDEDDPQEVPTSCAKCHSTYGYLDFLGLDGTDFGTVDNPAPIGSTVTCAACHNSATMAMNTVTFPSGEIVTGLGKEARCMQCHQGRQSTPQVDAAIETAAVEDDVASEDLGFKNVHYFAAGATLYGSQVKGGYEYAEKYFDGKFDHEIGYDSCIKCHDVHSLELKIDQCATCHAGDVDDYRMPGSTGDYDGDGNVEEGVKAEIEGLQELVYAALQAYALDTLGTGIIYDSHSYPYFFVDTNENGEADEDEVNYGNKYAAWSPRLLRAAYNYQYSLKDPGAFAHNAKYIVGLLYESAADLGADVEGLARSDGAHFNVTSEAWRHWDEDGFVVSASCARCHSDAGIKYFVENGQDTAMGVPASDGLSCMACHTGTDYAGDAPRKFVAEVQFPSGNSIENDAENPDDSFLCMSCHQGRESKTSIDEAIAAGSLGFKNIHYAPAGGIIYGDVAGIAYEYEGMDYAGQWTHYDDGASAQCAVCHNLSGEAHTFAPELKASCQGCHSEADGELDNVRKNRPTDYDGDGDNTEMLKDELHTLADALFAQIQTVAADSGSYIIYDSHAYPYFFKDTNENGEIDPGEAIYPNKYAAWTADMMKAAHNFQAFQKEHGAWAHNTDYMAQLLIDAIESLGGDVSGFNRP